MKASRLRRISIAAAIATALPAVVIAQTPAAQSSTGERARVLAVADTALAAISRGDFVGFTDLMIDEALILSVRERDGEFQRNIRTRAAQRTASPRGTVTERGFRPEVHISGPLAVVWLPYDLYIDGNWSHCGVDAFTLVRSGAVWKIASVAWSIEQPPACERHPGGPPRQ